MISSHKISLRANTMLLGARSQKDEDCTVSPIYLSFCNKEAPEKKVLPYRSVTVRVYTKFEEKYSPILRTFRQHSPSPLSFRRTYLLTSFDGGDDAAKRNSTKVSGRAGRRSSGITRSESEGVAT